MLEFSKRLGICLGIAAAFCLGACGDDDSSTLSDFVADDTLKDPEQVRKVRDLSRVDELLKNAGLTEELSRRPACQGRNG